jgi:hypothetical protein
VESGGDKIALKWTPPANSTNLDGYVIYRCESTVKGYLSFYRKIYDCPASTTSYDDTSASRGFKYYYYIQSKDNGSRNDVHPGVPLYSSLFLTLTSKPAYLLRPAGNLLSQVRVVPNPFDIRSRKWQFGDASGLKGEFDKMMFYELPPKCKLKIYSENGTLIWEKEHTNTSGDESWDSKTSSGQLVVSGVYILYVQVTEDVFAKEDKVAKWDITDEHMKLSYRTGETIYSAGDKIFSAGQSTIRKFVVIR